MTTKTHKITQKGTPTMNDNHEMKKCGCGTAHDAIDGALKEINRLVQSDHCMIWITWVATTFSVAAHEAAQRWLIETGKIDLNDDSEENMMACYLQAAKMVQNIADGIGDMLTIPVVDAVHGNYQCREVTKTH